jgi:PAS domain S-box-containing protein
MSYRVDISEDEIKRHREAIESWTEGFDLLSDHVVITDSNGNLLYANKAAQEKTGYAFDEMLGKNPGDLWGGQMPDDLYEGMWRTIKDERLPGRAT